MSTHKRSLNYHPSFERLESRDVPSIDLTGAIAKAIDTDRQDVVWNLADALGTTAISAPWTVVGQNASGGDMSMGTYGPNFRNQGTILSGMQPPDDPLQIGKNVTADRLVLGDNYYWEPGSVMVHPGDLENPVIRWTAPADGVVDIKTLLRDANPNGGDGVSYTLMLKHGSTLTTLTQGLLENGHTDNLDIGQQHVTVSAGDVVSLMISGKGSSGDPHNIGCDMTAIVEQMHMILPIDKTPVPAPVPAPAPVAPVSAPSPIVTTVTPPVTAAAQTVSAPQALSLPIASVIDTAIPLRTSVDASINGDMLALRARFFDGATPFTLGNAVITPEAGDHLLAVPLSIVPSDIRGNLPLIQQTINGQMTTVRVPAKAASSADLFAAPSSVGTWVLQMEQADGTFASVQTTALSTGIDGVAALNGIMPDGPTGKDIVIATPRFAVTRLDDQTIQIQMANMPAGYTLAIDKKISTNIGGTSWSYNFFTTKAITSGAFTTTIPGRGGDYEGLIGYRWTIRNPDNAPVANGEFGMGEAPSLALPQIVSPVPAGTKDLPRTVAINTGNAPVAISSSPNGTNPLPSHSLLVHPTVGKDVRLSFTPASAGRAMLYGTISDLDARAGDGVSLSLAVRGADGTMRPQWTRQLGNGESIADLSSDPAFATTFDLASGESLVLTVCSGSDDLCDSIAVDARVACLPKCDAAACEYPMAILTPQMQQLLAAEIIEQVNLFNRGTGIVTFDSPSADIARIITNGAYDTMSPDSQSAYRSAIDQAKGHVWDTYLSVVSSAFQSTLLAENGITMPADTSAIVDITGHNALASIPNLPSRAEVKNMITKNFANAYSTYARICGDANAELAAQALEAGQKAAIDQAIHDALSAAGLLHIQDESPSARSLSDQQALDTVFTQLAGAPDRAGWTVADVQRFDTLVAAQNTLVASVGSNTNITSGISMNVSKGTLVPGQHITWQASLEKGNQTVYSFSVDQPVLLQGNFSLGLLEGAALTLRSEKGDILAQTTVDSEQSRSQSTLNQTLMKGNYTITVQGTERFSSPFISTTIDAQLQQTSLSSITGTVELAGRQTSVKMSRFMLDPTDPMGQRTIEAYIDPNAVAWIVIHGRADNPDSAQMRLLEKSLFDFANKNGQQVIEIDWREAANDNLKILGYDMGDLHDASWTPVVGNWVAGQTNFLGIDHAKINFAAESHGTYVAFFAAQSLMENGSKVQSIVALDPARNIQFVNGFDASKIVFSEVAKNSVAIKSSLDQNYIEQLQKVSTPEARATLLALEDAEFGSTEMAKTANHVYEVLVPGSMDPFAVHRYSMELFAHLVEQTATQSTSQVAGLALDIRQIYTSSSPEQSMNPDRPFDATIIAMSQEVIAADNEKYMDAVFQSFR